jgi:hypothetical protein
MICTDRHIAGEGGRRSFDESRTAVCASDVLADAYIRIRVGLPCLILYPDERRRQPLLIRKMGSPLPCRSPTLFD